MKKQTVWKNVHICSSPKHHCPSLFAIDFSYTESKTDYSNVTENPKRLLFSLASGNIEKIGLWFMTYSAFAVIKTGQDFVVALSIRGKMYCSISNVPHDLIAFNNSLGFSPSSYLVLHKIKALTSKLSEHENHNTKGLKILIFLTNRRLWHRTFT